MKTRSLLSLSLLALLGCTERIQEGGFETSDLQARVTRPDGSPVAAARVWLVRSLGDSAPAAAIDSTLTDSAGRARFLYGKGADLSTIGLDAQSGDSLGMAPLVFGNGTSAEVAIQESKSVQIGPDSTGRLLDLHVPGSHFASRVLATGGASVLALPKGTWDVAIGNGRSVHVVHALAVLEDTVLSGVAGVRAVDTTSKAVDSLRDGPDIELDSFRVDGMVQYVDTSLPPAWAWNSPGGGDMSSWISNATFVEEDTGWTVLSSRPTIQIRDSIAQDTVRLQGYAEILSPTLPATGTIALRMSFVSGPSTDTNLVRRISFFDSSGRGLELFLQRPTSSQDSFGLAAYSSTSIVRLRTDTSAQLDADTWYFGWTSDSIVVRNSIGIVGTAKIQGGFLARSRLSVLVRTKHPFGDTRVEIPRTRLYKPR